MPRQRMVNTFAPQTPWGQGLQNIAAALFESRLSAPQEEERQRLMEAQRDYYVARASNELEQAELQRQERENRANFLANAVKAIFGPQRGSEILRYRETGSFGQEPSYGAMTGGLDAQDVPLVERSRPAWYTPEVESQVRRLAEMAAAAAANLGNYEQLAKGVQAGFQQGVQEGVLRGEIDPTRAAQAFGKLIFDIGDGTVFNQLTGELGPVTQLGRARIDTERSRQDAWSAQARANEALAKQREAERNRIVQERRIPIQDPLTGHTVYIPESEVGKAYLDRNKPRATEKRPLRVTTQDARAFLGALDRLSGANEKGVSVDPVFESKFLARATELFRNPESEAYGNHELAAQMALDELAPGGFKETGKFNPFVPNILVPKDAQAGTTKPAMQGGSPPPSAAPSAGKQKSPPRPKGKTDAQLIDEANKAIQEGADRNAVIKRLQEWGVRIN